MYYVYAHYKADDPTGLPFYIGKGKDQRETSETRNRFWKNIVNKHGFVSKRLYENLTEEAAWDIEVSLIKEYGKLSEGSGCLCNLSNGGEGAAGVTHSKETKKKWSDAKKGKTWEEIFGVDQAQRMRKESKMKKRKPHSEETKKKLSDCKKGKNNPMFGKDFTDEHRQKLSEAQIGNTNTKGKKYSEETRQNYKKAAILRAARKDICEQISIKLTGIKRSEETRKKMSDAAKAREALKKLNKGKL